MKVTVKQYAQTLLELTDGKSEAEVLDVIKKFTEVLQKDGQFKNTEKITEKFVELYNAKNGIVGAIVTSARKLSEQQISEIEKFVKGKYQAKEVEIENIVDEHIKGGVVIKVGDEVMDGSIEGQLKKMRKELVK